MSSTVGRKKRSADDVPLTSAKRAVPRSSISVEFDTTASHIGGTQDTIDICPEDVLPTFYYDGDSELERLLPELPEAQIDSAYATLPTESSAIICCGMIDSVKCQLLKTLPSVERTRLEDALLDDKYVRLAFQQQSDRYQLLLDSSTPIATLNNIVAMALTELSQLDSVSFVPFADLEQLLGVINSRTQRILQICVNVHGESRHVRDVGAILSDRGVYLQEPDWRDTSIEYHNPHMITFNSVSDADIWFEGVTLAARRNGDVIEVANWGLALDHLPQHHSSPLDFDRSFLLVPLLDHQLEGLNFMLKRETSDLDMSLKYWHSAENGSGLAVFKHSVTRDEASGPLVEPKGGILADDMGLGKTLTSLTTIATSLDRAAAFSSMPSIFVPETTHLWTRSRATLIVLPSELILRQWVDEIKTKFKPDSLTHSIYHGQERTRDYAELLDYDIVFTTYGTVAKEHIRKKKMAMDILYRIEWFRIVLDEAHVIRSQRSKQFTAIISLQAEHHWCLTGTPISNKVDDLGALVKFCRVPMLEDHNRFREHVTKVAKRSFKAGCGAIQRTLAPLCLRRTKALLNLPEPLLTTCYVEFSEHERLHYNNVFKQCRIALEKTASGHGKVKHTMLESILRLRIFCNQGTFSTFAKPRADDGLDPDEALALLQQNDDAKCSVCLEDVLIINQANTQECGVLATCSHVLCRLCYDNAIIASNDKQPTCPSCKQDLRQTTLQPWQGPEDLSSRVECHSSKLDQLINDLSRTQGTEKSLVLSYWKRTIDVTSELCAAKNVNFVRIDGTIAQPDRRAALDKFISEVDTSTLLMTMGTGALGLNLTAATRIHILEPQWNPAVEEQAIGRLFRIGQKKNITVIRYLVRRSIEEQIQVYQKRKIQLIAGGFGGSSDAAVEAHTKLLTATFFAAQVANESGLPPLPIEEMVG